MVFGADAKSLDFGEYVKTQMNALVHEQAEFQAEIKRLENMDEQTFMEYLHEGDFQEFGKVLTAMYVTSQKTEKTIQLVHGACMAAVNVSSNSKQQKVIQDYIKELLDVERESMGYAERLPLTIGKGGWYPRGGEESLAKKIRMLVNLPGYILVLGAENILGSEKSRALSNTYHRNRQDFEETLKKFHEAKALGEYKEEKKLQEEVRRAIKDFGHYMQVARRVGQKYRRLQKRTNGMLKKEGVARTIIHAEDIERYAIQGHVHGAKRYARRGY